jgi:hypothetical protein
VHVREDGRNAADLARWFRFPGGRIKTLNEHLVQTVVHSKDLHCGSVESRASILFTLGHSCAFLDG